MVVMELKEKNKFGITTVSGKEGEIELMLNSG